VLTQDLVYPDDLALESDQLLGHYGAGWGGIGHLLLSDGVALPPELGHWATARDVPASQLGSWVPRLVTFDGAPQVSLSRDFGTLWAFATTYAGRHVLGLAPSTEELVKLVNYGGERSALPLGPAWRQLNSQTKTTEVKLAAHRLARHLNRGGGA